MDSDPILQPLLNRKKGKLIHESEVIMPNSKNSVRAALYQNMVVIDHQCIIYHFDIKFTMKKN